MTPRDREYTTHVNFVISSVACDGNIGFLLRVL